MPRLHSQARILQAHEVMQYVQDVYSTLVRYKCDNLFCSGDFTSDLSMEERWLMVIGFDWWCYLIK